MVRPIGSVIVPLLLLITTGCGSATSDPPTAEPPPPAAVQPTASGGLPALRVRGAGDAVDLQPITWCWTQGEATGCADGVRPDELTDLGAAEELVLTFAEPGWTFEASFRPTGQPCGRVQTVPVEQVGAQEHRIPPAGPAGTYDVDLSGRGPQGDLFTAARWTTTTEGRMPTPTASAVVLADQDGTVDSYGMAVQLDDLGATPGQAEATITVTSSEGRSSTFEVTRIDEDCQEEGRVWFSGSVEQGREAAALGSAPFTYTVDLVLDGRAHTATATWPADELEDLDPAVGLVFAPDLPAMASSTAEH